MGLDKFVYNIYVTDDYLIRYALKYMKAANKLKIKLRENAMYKQ
jgi:hypothetical protein